MEIKILQPNDFHHHLRDKEDWIVPNRYGNLIPLYNGKKIKWKIKDF
jgi:dihydroorotase